MMKIVIITYILVILFGCNNTRTGKNMLDNPHQFFAKNINEFYEESLSSKGSSIEVELEEKGLLDIKKIDSSIQLKLKYATEDNFTKIILYDSLTKAYLHPIAVDKLLKAQRNLKEKDSTLSLLVYDAVRPLSIQKKMYEVVQNTPYHAYVANPAKTGLHNYGLAVDLTICDNRGIPLDMGTPFDYFGRKAGISEEEILVNEGKLTRQQVDNRQLLRSIMVDAGFLTIRGEWWHFNALPLNEAKKRAKLIE